MSTPIQHRYDFIYLFDVTDGNPNGDPDAGNLPRIDAETGQGLVTDVCLKRKIRNYVGLAKESANRFRIFVRERAILNDQIEEAYSQSEEVKRLLKEWDAYRSDKKKPKPRTSYEDAAAKWLCDQFYDIRTFGAVLTTGDEKEVPGVKSKMRMTAGQIRGPVQLAFARSIDPIFSQEHALTVCAARSANKPIEAQIGIQGRKATVPYGLYCCRGHISPAFAKHTGFDDGDVAILRNAINMMFEHDKSSARASMSPVRCIAFRHDNKLGNARADQLFARVKVEPVEDVKSGKRPPRSKDGYVITIEGAGDLPEGVSIEEWV